MYISYLKQSVDSSRISDDKILILFEVIGLAVLTVINVFIRVPVSTLNAMMSASECWNCICNTSVSFLSAKRRILKRTGENIDRMCFCA